MIGLLDWIAASWWHTFTGWWVGTLFVTGLGFFRPVRIRNHGDDDD